MDRNKWVVVGVGVLILLGVGFAIFRPDKAFTDQRVDDTFSDEFQAALDDAASSTASTMPPETTPPVAGDTAPPTSAPATASGERMVVSTGQFGGQTDHSVSGSASILDSGSVVELALVDLDSDNGPDLQLYLSPRSDGSVDGGVKIGPLRGNQGNQVYTLPDGVDLSEQTNVVIWCERFSTPFGTATLDG